MTRAMIAVAGTLCAAAAAPTIGQTFTDRDAFTTAASDAGVLLNAESFEGLPITGSAAESSFTLDDFTVVAVNEGFEFLSPLGIQGLTGAGGTFATDGEQHLNVGSLYSSADDNDVVVNFTFDSPITALFWDITDLKGLDQAPSPRAILTTDAGDEITLLDGRDGTQDLLTIGLINPAGFTEVSVRSTAGDSFGFDNLVYGIPSPGAAALLCVAGGAALRRRR
jgi:hypothetical protein